MYVEFQAADAGSLVLCNTIKFIITKLFDILQPVKLGCVYDFVHQGSQFNWSINGIID